MSPERKDLQVMEMSGRYVFHGTGEDLDVLEPQKQKDGPAAVFASSSADYAIFFAIFNKKNCPLGRRASAGDYDVDGSYKLHLRASAHTMSQINDSSTGFVYVFERKEFFLRQPGGIEYANRQPVKPIKKIQVKKSDLLSSVTVFQE